MPAHFSYISDNPFRLCDMSAAIPFADLRRAATKTAASVAVGNFSEPALHGVFGNDDAAKVKDIVNGLVSNAEARTLHRIFWFLAYKHPHLPQPGGETVSTLADLNSLAKGDEATLFATQTRFLRSWCGFLAAPGSDLFTATLKNFDAFCNDAACDAALIALLEAEKVRDATNVLEKAHQSALAAILSTGGQTAARLWHDERYSDAEAMLKAICAAPFDADTVDRHLRNFAPVGDRSAADVEQADSELVSASAQEVLSEYSMERLHTMMDSARRLSTLANILAGRVVPVAIWSEVAALHGETVALRLRRHAIECANKNNDFTQSRAIIRGLLKEPLASPIHERLKGDITRLREIEDDYKREQAHKKAEEAEPITVTAPTPKFAWVALVLSLGFLIWIGTAIFGSQPDSSSESSSPETFASETAPSFSESEPVATIDESARVEEERNARIVRLETERSQLASEIEAGTSAHLLHEVVLKKSKNRLARQQDKIRVQRLMLDNYDSEAVRKFNRRIGAYDKLLDAARESVQTYNAEANQINAKIERSEAIDAALREMGE